MLSTHLSYENMQSREQEAATAHNVQLYTVQCKLQVHELTSQFNHRCIMTTTRHSATLDASNSQQQLCLGC